MERRNTDEEIIQAIGAYGMAGAARKLGVSERSLYIRRNRIELVTGNPIKCKPYRQSPAVVYPSRLPLDVRNGVVLVGSDAHYWPDMISTAHRALCYFIKELQPKAVIMNGDVFDGASISRHPPLGWESKPTVKQELEAVTDRLHEIALAGRKAKLFWTSGNHDQRFEMKLAAQAGEFEGVAGFRLADHFPTWQMAMSIWVNDNVVIKHRCKGGVHATHNNTVTAGRSIVTGHLHSLKVTPFSDYDGTRYGVDTGTLSDPYGPHAAYGEDNPLNHRSGFAVLTFHNGRLLWPELVAVVDEETVEFRGKVWKV